MTTLLITNAGVIVPDQVLSGHAVACRDGRITWVGPSSHAPTADADCVLDAPGQYLAPGFIDIHIHGGGGFSLSTTDPEEIRSYARWVTTHGVTGFLPTVVPTSRQSTERCLAAAASVGDRVEGGAQPLGLNLEGPFVSSKRLGALPRKK